MTVMTATAPEFFGTDTIEDNSARTDLSFWSRLAQSLHMSARLANSTDPHITESIVASSATSLLEVTQPVYNVEKAIEAARTRSVEAFESFKVQFLNALKCEPFEDGVPHPAETVIQGALAESPYSILQWTHAIFQEHYSIQPLLAATILRIIGRLPRHQVGEAGLSMAQNSLKHQDVGVRLSAVRALESWGGQRALGILITHLACEPQKWLVKYIEQVIKDLTS
jgi:hypothetical protein